MMELILAGCLGLAVGFGGCWLFIRKLPQDKVREINYDRLKAEQEMLQHQREIEEREMRQLTERRIAAMEDCENARKECEEAMRRINLLTIQKDTLSNEVSYLVSQREEITKSLEQSKKDAEYSAKVFLSQQMDLATEQLDRSLEQAAAEYQENEDSYRDAYLLAMKECADEWLSDIEALRHLSEETRAQFQELQKNVEAAVAAAKREEEKRQEKNFYRLIIPEQDYYEISQLRAVEPYLRDKEALNKVIWKVYYEKPYTDMIGRVIGASVKTGIYKITNMTNNMCYVGQAANIADRWRQHIKRGLGAETPTRNKLYPAMSEYGVENFTFEIVEECERSALDSREDFWQDYFHAKDFGYSIK